MKNNVEVMTALMKRAAIFMFGMVMALALPREYVMLAVTFLFVALVLASCLLIDMASKDNKEAK